MIGRREMLKLTAAGGAAAFSVLGWPGAVFAAAPGERRLIVVVLRGAMDGLAAVPPLADAQYREKRGSLALPMPGEAGGCLTLAHGFALHPALAPLYPYWQKDELLFVHASGNGYRTRSHFDAQDLMESGLSVKRGMSDGWLNRALALLQHGRDRLGLAVGGAVPLILRGKVAVASWEPPSGMRDASPEFIAALAPLYRADPLLGPALAGGLKAQHFSESVLGDAMEGGRGFGPKTFAPLAQAAGKLLAADDGPRIAELEMLGWDTHVNQGAAEGRLAQNFAGYAEGLAALAAAMGDAWLKTVLVAVTEFGRTVAVNGNNGTDHGTASVLLVLGGAVKGGRIAGDWPGLSQLQDDRDLRVATDSRSVMKGILRDHLGLDRGDLARKVFPDVPELKPFDGLVKV
ncbi:MAG TPA: DUF1501 domain-containing protein [Stellaceae bacterium]|nr:DUF1501 domain-containing protein [Stellaceae bacterium]